MRGDADNWDTKTYPFMTVAEIQKNKQTTRPLKKG